MAVATVAVRRRQEEKKAKEVKEVRAVRCNDVSVAGGCAEQ